MIVAEQSINKLKEDSHHANGEVVAPKAAPHQSVLNYIGQHRYYVLGACLGRRLSAVVHGEWSVTFMTQCTEVIGPLGRRCVGVHDGGRPGGLVQPAQPKILPEADSCMHFPAAVGSLS